MASGDMRADDVIYDTVLCTLFIDYDMEKKTIREIYLISNFCYTGKSSLHWSDMLQYGACDYTCSVEEYPALAELIQDKDWRWTTRHDALDVDHAAGNVSQELKDEVLKEMLQTKASEENV